MVKNHFDKNNSLLAFISVVQDGQVEIPAMKYM